MSSEGEGSRAVHAREPFLGLRRCARGAPQFPLLELPPAAVLMGGAASLSIGFMPAGVGLASSSKATIRPAIAIPVVSRGLPSLDTDLVIVRRLLGGEGVHKRLGVR